MEHGIGSLIPFIAKYFPGSRVVPLVFDENQQAITIPNQLVEKLYQILQKDTACFLLVSVDLSHKAQLSITEQRDKESIIYLKSLKQSDYFRIFSDNNSSLYILGHFLQRLGNHECYTLCHTNSYFYSGQQPEDITSYFFTYYTVYQ